MAFSKLSSFLFVLACAFLLHSYPVHCNEKEDLLLRGINSYRASKNVSDLKYNDRAACFADEIADGIEDQPCSGSDGFSGDPSHMIPRLVNFHKLAKKCDVDVNTTMDAAILPVCVPKLAADFVLNNFTKTAYTKFINDSTYTGAGIGSEDDWIVVVLTTDKPGGSFSGATPVVAFGMVSFLGLFLSMLSF